MGNRSVTAWMNDQFRAGIEPGNEVETAYRKASSTTGTMSTAAVTTPGRVGFRGIARML